MSAISRLAKLRAMPMREILARAAYEGQTSWERVAHLRGRLAAGDRLRRALAPRLARQADWRERLVARDPSAHFFLGVQSGEHVRPLFAAQYAAEAARTREVADDAAQGRIAFFGRQFSFGTRIDWHADPVTGAAWPRRYHRDVPVHGGNVGFGDVKDVWEINRHQFFVDLAKAAWLDRSARHAGALHGYVLDWMDQVPYGTGAAWACALEPAFRAWSWMWAYHLVREAGLLDDETHRQWLTGFFDHGRFLYRHLERYASPYNHLIGEASALFALGILFPEFTEAVHWRDRGRRVLESTVRQQFHADGGTVEQSSFYHHATLGFYLLAAVLGRANGVEISSTVIASIERALEFSAALVQPDGRVPRIGGADDGKPIRMEHLPFWDFRPYYAVGAALFSRADFKFVAGRFWEDALWMLGPEGLDVFERLQPREPERMAALPSSGYYVARSDWSPSADYLCFDCGNQAAGLRRDDVPSAAHGHADCLSVIVALGGREVLVDPGFFCYNGDPAWEVHFRKTSAHNTIAIDGRDQARHLAKMAWARTYRAQPEGWTAGAGEAWVAGSHDGYARDAQGVTHRRTAWLRDDGYVVIHDELTGEPGAVASAVFQFAPGTLHLEAAGATFDGRYELAWTCSVPVTARMVAGGERPGDGWIATSLGVRVAAPKLTLEFQVAERRVVLVTVLADRRRVPAAATRLRAGWHESGTALAVSIRRVEGDDEVIAPIVGRVSGEIDSDAPLLIVRRNREGITGVTHARGTYARARRSEAAPAPQAV